MHVNRLATGGLVVLLCLPACTLLPFLGRAESPAAAPTREDASARAVLELQNMRFDGERLSGRLLVGVETGAITFDRRLVENVSVELKSIVDCANGQPLAFLEVDSFPVPPEPDELLTLTPGYWYGADVRFALFDTHFTGPALPECFEGELRLRTESGHIPGRLPLRVERSVKPPPPADAAGAPAP